VFALTAIVVASELTLGVLPVIAVGVAQPLLTIPGFKST
jgi:hypothetical protein